MDGDISFITGEFSPKQVVDADELMAILRLDGAHVPPQIPVVRTNPIVVLVAVIGANNVLPREGQLPWRLKSDLRHFKRVTINRPVVMGRKTYVSIGKPLKDRTNIILTSDLGLIAPGCVLATSLDAALGFARQDCQKRGVDEIMIIGGSDVFAAMMPSAARLEITHVHASPEGDVKFPPIDPGVWREVSRQEVPPGPDDSAAFAVAEYVRR